MRVRHAFESLRPDSTDLTKIQPSHWNADHVIVGSNSISSDEYNFEYQVPGGTLSAGVAATITLRPVPEGINAANSNHKLYINGGVGIAEVVTISGGTAVSGANSGTIIFTPANNHSGSWRIQSATDGIQEAIYSVSRPSVFVPPGSHTIYGTINLPVGTHLFGSGWNSWLLLGTVGMTLIQCLDLDAFPDVHIHDFYIAGHSGNTSEKGIHLRRAFGFHVYNIKADSVYRLLYVDTVSESWFHDLLLLNDTSLYFSALIDPVAGFCFQNVIERVNHYATIANLTVPEIIYLGHAAIFTVRSIKIRSCRYDCIGIRIAGGGEGLILDDITMVQPTYGIQLESLNARFPFFNNISRVQIDQAAIIGIYLTIGTYTTIEHCSITGRNDDGAYPDDPSNAIYINEAAHNTTIHNNKFQNWYAGRVIQLHDNATEVTITNNQFANGSGTVGNILLGTTSGAVNNHILITNNIFTFYDAAPIKIGIGGLYSAGETVLIENNVGVDDTYGGDIAVAGSNQTIQAIYPIHTLTGTGFSIRTINHSTYYRNGELKLVLAGGSSGTLVTGDNVGVNITLVAGRVLQLFYNRVDNKWYPSYV